MCSTIYTSAKRRRRVVSKHRPRHIPVPVSSSTEFRYGLFPSPYSNLYLQYYCCASDFNLISILFLFLTINLILTLTGTLLGYRFFLIPKRIVRSYKSDGFYHFYVLCILICQDLNATLSLHIGYLHLNTQRVYQKLFLQAKLS